MSEKKITFLNLVFIIGILIFLLIASHWAVEPFELKSIEDSNILQILSSFLVIAIIAERFLDVFLTTLRAPISEKIEADILELKNNVTPENKDKVKKMAEKLQLRKQKTRMLALFFSLIIGLVISSFGIRTLENLIILKENHLSWQISFMRFTDILLTGGLISGGSDGIHKIIEFIRDYSKKES
ncbi:MAG: hypothetical protein ACEPO8_05310 [Rhodothermaceae bacterium]